MTASPPSPVPPAALPIALTADSPPTDAERTLLRAAVAQHARSEPRRVFSPVLHAGRPGGPETVFGLAGLDSPGGPLDHALRTDVVEALLRATHDVPERLLWLTRPGPLDLHEADVRWAAASRAARAETGVVHRFVVVTRHGWRDPCTGAGRSWRRMRA
ncbi:hypothetical protein [Nocardioides fonticola]|uniref:hypothetical protein n=1 Tax=Nocardioides fonticola TaxID=450363 RepID=UPI0031D6BDAC